MPAFFFSLEVGVAVRLGHVPRRLEALHEVLHEPRCFLKRVKAEKTEKTNYDRGAHLIKSVRKHKGRCIFYRAADYTAPTRQYELPLQIVEKQ